MCMSENSCMNEEHSSTNNYKSNLENKELNLPQFKDTICET